MDYKSRTKKEFFIKISKLQAINNTICYFVIKGLL